MLSGKHWLSVSLQCTTKNGSLNLIIIILIKSSDRMPCQMSMTLFFSLLLQSFSSQYLQLQQLTLSIHLFLLQAFLLIFFSELGDKTFFIAVRVIIYTKYNWEFMHVRIWEFMIFCIFPLDQNLISFLIERIYDITCFSIQSSFTKYRSGITILFHL